MYTLLLHSLSRHVCLTEQEKDLLCSCFVVKTFQKKDYLLHTGEVFRHATFVNKGCFSMYSVDKDGKAHVAQIAMEGWWAGDIYSFLTQKPSEYFVEALEEAQVLQISRQQLEELYSKVPKMERYFRILVQNAYISFRNRVVSSMSQSALERYQEFTQTYPLLEQRIPLYTIASYLGIRPEFLSRLRKKLSKPSSS
jgi:CRP-like cAMP-binding protein